MPMRRTIRHNLTPTEERIAKALLSGASNKEIGRDFGISPRTAEVHRRNITEKMGATSAVHLGYLLTKAGFALDEKVNLSRRKQRDWLIP